MRFRLSRHAMEEMVRRAIPAEILDQVLNTPQQVVPVRGCKQAYQSQLDFGGGKMFLVRAIVSEDADPAVVVTVYRTTKIDKYWRTT